MAQAQRNPEATGGWKMLKSSIMACAGAGCFIMIWRTIFFPAGWTNLIHVSAFSFMIVRARWVVSYFPFFFLLSSEGGMNKWRKQSAASITLWCQNRINKLLQHYRGPLFSKTSRKISTSTWRGRHKPPAAQVIVQALLYFLMLASPPLDAKCHWTLPVGSHLVRV